jgi:hypothetical protein
METRYPIYIISKGRPTCITARALNKLGLPYKIVVEPHQLDDYKQKHPDADFLTTPFKNLGQGSIPARNFVWEHSITAGHKKHWILDDNIEDFNRLNRNKKPPVRTPAPFVAAEDFTDRFTNVALSGFNYYSLCKATSSVPPFYLNTRIYSCILINNSIPFRWRGRYNEDTDLSLRALKAGYCTILFNAFLAGKVTTQRMKGGNTEELYAATDDRREFAESLRDQHPDVVRVTRKFGRWHHHVNYKPFKNNKLVLRDEIEIPEGINNYGMVLGQEER